MIRVVNFEVYVLYAKNPLNPKATIMNFGVIKSGISQHKANDIHKVNEMG